jgi:hypothetical protein
MFLLQQSHRQDPGRGDLPCYLQAGEQEEGLIHTLQESGRSGRSDEALNSSSDGKT